MEIIYLGGLPVFDFLKDLVLTTVFVVVFAFVAALVCPLIYEN